MHIREKCQNQTSGVIKPQKGDILILMHHEYDDFPIHAMICGGEAPLDFPIKENMVLHAVKSTEQLTLHTLPFYLSHSYGGPIYIFRPKNNQLAERAFNVATQWIETGVYFDKEMEAKQKPSDGMLAQQTFTPLRSLKQHYLGTYANYYNVEFSQAVSVDKREVGVTCHSFIIDAYNLAATRLFYESEELALSENSVHSRMSNYGKIPTAMESQVLLAFKKNESENHKKQGAYYSPVNYMTIQQREKLNNGDLKNNMAFQLNSKIATLQNFFDYIKNLDQFVLVSQTQNKNDFQQRITKNEYASKAIPFEETLKSRREILRGKNIQLHKNSDLKRRENVEHRRSGITFFNSKNYKKAMEAYSKEDLSFMFPVEKADHFYCVGRSYEELGNLEKEHAREIHEKAIENFKYAETIYSNFFSEDHADLKKTKNKIEALEIKNRSTI